MASYVKSEITEMIDKETGEVFTIETAKTWTAKQSVEEFYMTFIDVYSTYFTKLNSVKAKDILTWMCMHAEFNTGRVLITPLIRQEICDKLEISSPALSNQLKLLKALKFIDGSKGTYYINPEIFWKGELSVRNKLLQDKNVTFRISIE